MAKTESIMVDLGITAPDFLLKNVITGQNIKLYDSVQYRATVIMFICNHCPYVKHINSELTRLANDYIKQGVRFIAINSNDIQSYPDDSPEHMLQSAIDNQYPFPYLFDETQEVAKKFRAACTPDFFIFDSNLTLVYRGQLDDSRPGNNIPVTGSSIREALNCMIEGKPLCLPQKPSIGCNIKWK